MAWSNAVTFKFIDLYRYEAALWNPNQPHHKDKKKVSDAWERISIGMNVPVDVLKKKKETLMSAFRLNHKKKLTSLKTGDPRDVFNPVWIFYEPMAEFLSDLYDYKNNIYSDDGASSSVSFQDKWNPVVEVGVEELSNEGSVDERRPLKRHRSESQTLPSTSSEKHLANTMMTLANVINVISKEILDREKDDCELYGKLTAMKLRELPVEERRELMYEIDTLFIQKSFKNEPS